MHHYDVVQLTRLSYSRQPRQNNVNVLVQGLDANATAPGIANILQVAEMFSSGQGESDREGGEPGGISKEESTLHLVRACRREASGTS